MPPEVAEHVFEPFYRAARAETSAQRPASTGLGLAIAAGIADAHAGTIAVESHPGEGSRFMVRLPRSTVAQERPATADVARNEEGGGVEERSTS